MAPPQVTTATVVPSGISVDPSSGKLTSDGVNANIATLQQLPADQVASYAKNLRAVAQKDGLAITPEQDRKITGAVNAAQALLVQQGVRTDGFQAGATSGMPKLNATPTTPPPQASAPTYRVGLGGTLVPTSPQPSPPGAAPAPEDVTLAGIQASGAKPTPASTGGIPREGGHLPAWDRLTNPKGAIQSKLAYFHLPDDATQNDLLNAEGAHAMREALDAAGPNTRVSGPAGPETVSAALQRSLDSNDAVAASKALKAYGGAIVSSLNSASSASVEAFGGLATEDTERLAEGAKSVQTVLDAHPTPTVEGARDAAVRIQEIYSALRRLGPPDPTKVDPQNLR